MRRLREAGCSEEELEAAIRDAPAHETAWLTGADGEARVGHVLKQWAAAKGFALLIDVTPPGQRANIDFIAVGSAGVFVVDAKAWNGTLRFNDGTMWIGRNGKTKDVVGVERQVEQIAAVLTAAGVILPVRGMMGMANSNPGLPRHGLEHVGDIGVGVPDEVGRAVGRPGLLGEVDVDRAVSALCAAFDMRGFVPQTLAERRPRLGTPLQGREVRRRVLAPALRRLLRPRVLLTLGCAAVALQVAGTMRSGKPQTTAVAAGDLRTAMPTLRTVAAHAAHGSIRGPAVKTTAQEIRLTFRRGRCRVIVRVDRRVADYAAGAKVTRGRGCTRRGA